MWWPCQHLSEAAFVTHSVPGRPRRHLLPDTALSYLPRARDPCWEPASRSGNAASRQPGHRALTRAGGRAGPGDGGLEPTDWGRNVLRSSSRNAVSVPAMTRARPPRLLLYHFARGAQPHGRDTVPMQNPVAGGRGPAWGSGAPDTQVTSQEGVLEFQDRSNPSGGLADGPPHPPPHTLGLPWWGRPCPLPL